MENFVFITMSHMNSLKRILIFVFAVVATLPLAAESFEEIRAKANTKGVVLGGGEIVGVIVGDCRSENVAGNQNVRFDLVDLRTNRRTNYLQSEDGKFGFRLVFESIYDNKLHRADKVKINLAGCTVVREDNPERYTISGIKTENIASCEAGASLTPKVKSINELTNADLYTYVALADVEFMNKQGAYTNVYEAVMLRSFLNQESKPQEICDGWASLLKDKNGESIYLLVNAKATWRRRGQGVPRGVGKVAGVLVNEKMRRYGDNLGPYSIRPINEEDIRREMPKEESSSYEVIADWNYDRNYRAELNIENLGKVRYSRMTQYEGRILPDVGTGYVWSNANAAYGLDTDYDTRYPHDNRGMRRYAGLRFQSNVSYWLEKNHGILVEFSTEGLSGKALTFDFSFGVGNHDINNCWGFPVYWNVMYSTDGVNFTKAKENIVLRSLPYNVGRVKIFNDRMNYEPSYDMAPGFTDHSVKLPASLFGQKKVVVLLTPASRRMATLLNDTSANTIQGDIPIGSKQNLILRMGRISVKYAK